MRSRKITVSMANMDVAYLIIGLVVGVAVGIVVGWLIADRRNRNAGGAIQSELAVTAERARDAAAELQETKTTLDDQRRDLSILQQDRAALEVKLQNAQNQLEQTLQVAQRTQGELSTANQTLNELQQHRASVEIKLNMAQEELEKTRQGMAKSQGELESSQQQFNQLHQVRAALEIKLNVSQEQLEKTQNDMQQSQSALDSAQNQLNDLHRERSTLIANLEAEKKMLAEQRDQLTTMANRTRETFAELSTQALKQNTSQFMELAEQKFKNLQTEASGTLEQKKAEMNQILQPMQQTLEVYKTKLEDLEKSRTQAYVDIKQHLTEVATTQKNLSVETRQLVQALRKPQGRGRWGELTLRRLFELAGMANRVTFVEQVTTDDGKFRPDCIVELPNDRKVIVDSKCVIDAFLDATECSDETLRAGHLARHAKQVRSRVNELSKKGYWGEFDSTAEFVVMFLPGEPFLYAAVEQDQTLIEDALASRVIVAAPSSLLGLLKIIEYGWRQKQIEESAKNIRDLATTLYERINTMADHFAKLGKSITNTITQYNKTVGSLERNVLSSARNMRELGVGDAPVAEIDEVSEHVRDLSNKAWAALPSKSIED